MSLQQSKESSEFLIPFVKIWKTGFKYIDRIFNIYKFLLFFYHVYLQTVNPTYSRNFKCEKVCLGSDFSIPINIVKYIISKKKLVFICH